MIWNWDLTGGIEEILEDLNEEMKARDGAPLPTVATEPPIDTRGEPFKRANKFTNVQSHGRWWVK